MKHQKPGFLKKPGFYLTLQNYQLHPGGANTGAPGVPVGGSAVRVTSPVGPITHPWASTGEEPGFGDLGITLSVREAINSVST
ncbi:hypothetical protein [Kamptonema formosum]|uniref:hypothetical protein n=1 Tax=Kamptonema formosum TaxID=331992 RepID=UPI00034DC134|nr:hypothetical protein [Oscillatoria sp. PCC 10802]